MRGLNLKWIGAIVWLDVVKLVAKQLVRKHVKVGVADHLLMFTSIGQVSLGSSKQLEHIIIPHGKIKSSETELSAVKSLLINALQDFEVVW